MAKKETKTDMIENRQHEKNNTPIKRVKVDRNLEVLVMNNTSGIFFYRCPKTHSIYEMNEYGDTTYITVDELLTMRNTHRRILDDLWLVLIDVESDEVTLDDVINYLGLTRLYNDVVKPDDIDGFILKSYDKRFKETIKKINKSILRKIVERAIVLYKQEKLTSISKINALKEITGNEELFE